MSRSLAQRSATSRDGHRFEGDLSLSHEILDDASGWLAFMDQPDALAGIQRHRLGRVVLDDPRDGGMVDVVPEDDPSLHGVPDRLAFAGTLARWRAARANPGPVGAVHQGPVRGP